MRPQPANGPAEGDEATASYGGAGLVFHFNDGEWRRVNTVATGVMGTAFSQAGGYDDPETAAAEYTDKDRRCRGRRSDGPHPQRRPGQA